METGDAASLSNKPLFMEPNQIKDAHFLDILFEGRNKAYGAYELRKTYNGRMVKSMVVMGSVVGLLLLGGVVSGKAKRTAKMEVGEEVILEKVADPPPPVTPPPPRVVQPLVATIAFTRPLIVKDDVKTDVKPPENDSLDYARIGATTTKGTSEDDVVGPPSNGTVGAVVEAPKRTESEDIFFTVEIEASYPGGMAAWVRFLNKNFHYPDEEATQGIGGTVLVQFVVDLDGNVSDVKIISGPEDNGLREEALRVIRKSGKWVPAVQNGRHVKSYRRQPVIFAAVPE
jgi:protein TonB